MVRQGGKPGIGTYPLPPVLGGAPVSPSAMTRVVVVKALVEVRSEGRASLVMDVRSILSGFRGMYRYMREKTGDWVI